MDFLNPADYHLPLSKYMEMADNLEMNEASALADLKIFRKRPEWFIENLNTNKLEYDSTLAMDMVMEERRRIRSEYLSVLPRDLRDRVMPSAKSVTTAGSALKRFFSTATQLLNLRQEQNMAPDKLAMLLDLLPHRLAHVQDFSGTIPESCIRICVDLARAVLTPITPEERWIERLSTSSKSAITLGKAS